jgi:transcriptional regulator of acetoin/glycerol metabolism
MNSGPVIHTVDLPSSVSVRRSTPAGTDERVVPLSVIESRTILKTIAQLNGGKMLAAKLLGIGKTTLYRKLKQYSASSGLSI